MKKSTLSIIYVLLLALASMQVAAQEDSATNKKNIFTVGANYATRLEYYGRTDSLKSSGFLPNIGYEFKWGLFAQANFILLHNPALPLTYAGATGQLGYRFPQSKHFSGSVSYTQIFYKDNTDLPQSALKGQASLTASYLNKYVNVNGGADLKFSTKNDVSTNIGLDHLFLFLLSKPAQPVLAIAVNPTANMYAGTQNFTVDSQKSLLGLPLSQQVTDNMEAFNILAYSFSMPVVLVAGKFNFSVTPTYVIPQNLLAGELGQKLFYVTLGTGIRL